MRKIQYHEYASFFPMMEEADLKELAEDIKERGLVHNIILHEGKILDGRNRYEACILAGVQPYTEHYEGDDPIGHVLSLNSKRRHLTKSQIAIAATEATPVINKLKAEARERQREHGNTAPGKPSNTCGTISTSVQHKRSTDQLGELMGVSGRTIRAAEQIKRTDPDTFEKIKKGEMSIGSARKKTEKTSSSQLPSEDKDLVSENPPDEENASTRQKKLRRLKHEPEPVPMAPEAVDTSDVEIQIPGFNSKLWASLERKATRVSHLMRNLNDSNLIEYCNEAEELTKTIKEEYKNEHTANK